MAAIGTGLATNMSAIHHRQVTKGFKYLGKAISALEKKDEKKSDYYFQIFRDLAKHNSDLKSIEEKVFNKVFKWNVKYKDSTDFKGTMLWRKADKQQFGKMGFYGRKGGCPIERKEKLTVLKAAKLSFLKQQLNRALSDIKNKNLEAAGECLTTLSNIDDPVVKSLTDPLFNPNQRQQSNTKRIRSAVLTIGIEQTLRKIGNEKLLIPKYIKYESDWYNLNKASRSRNGEILEFERLDTSRINYSSNRKLFDSIFEYFPGVVIGESHDDPISTKLIVDNLAYFKSQGVNTIFIEIAHEHQADFDNYFKYGMMSSKLESELIDIDKGWQLSGPYSNLGLVKRARDAGLRIVAIDSNEALKVDSSERLPHMNYCAAKIVKHEMKKGKFIALVGKNHLSVYEENNRNYPGLGELLKCPVIDVNKDLNGHISKDNLRATCSRGFVRHDFTISDPKI